MKALVLYYSNTGNTQKVARALAASLDAELGEITCPAYLNWYGPLAMAWDIFTRHRPRVNIVAPKHASHDLVVVGGPVWAAHAAPPTLAALQQLPGEVGKLALFVTCRGTSPTSPPEPAISDMQAVAARPAIVTRVFREEEIRWAGLDQRIAEFSSALTGQV